jgi:hypothetical protein
VLAVFWAHAAREERAEQLVGFHAVVEGVDQACDRSWAAGPVDQTRNLGVGHLTITSLHDEQYTAAALGGAARTYPLNAVPILIIDSPGNSMRSTIVSAATGDCKPTRPTVDRDQLAAEAAFYFGVPDDHVYPFETLGTQRSAVSAAAMVLAGAAPPFGRRSVAVSRCRRVVGNASA